MIEAVLLIGVASWLLVNALRRLAVDRFPHPIDLTILSIYYYAVPLTIAALFVIKTRIPIFLTEAASDPSLATEAMEMVVLALMALIAGRYAARLLGPGGVQFWFPLTPARVNFSRVWFFILGGLIAGGIVLFGWREFIAGYATESEVPSAALGNGLVFFAVEAFGMFFAYCLLVKLVTGRLPHKGLIFAAVLVMLFVLGARQKRLEVLSAILPVAVILLSTRRRTSTIGWRVGAAIAAMFLLVAIAAVRLSDELSFGSAAFYAFAEGVYAGHALPGILLRLGVGAVEYENGARILNGLLGFIPRFIWPEKDDMIFAGNLAIDGVSPLGATSLLAEIVLQGSVVAVLICYGMMGFFFERLMRFQDDWDVGLARAVIPVRFGLYLVVIAIVIPHYRDGIVPSIKLALQDMLMFCLIAGMRPLHSLVVRRFSVAGG